MKNAVVGVHAPGARRKRSSRWRAVVSALAMVGSAAAAVPAALAAVVPPVETVGTSGGLLVPAAPPDPGVAQLSRPAAIRERFVTADVAGIEAALRAAGADRTIPLRFELFADTTMQVPTVTFDAGTEWVSVGATGVGPDGLTQTATVTVTWVHGAAKTVVGDFWDGNRVYALRAATPSVYAVAEVDQGALHFGEDDDNAAPPGPDPLSPGTESPSTSSPLDPPSAPMSHGGVHFVDVLVVHTQLGAAGAGNVNNWITQANTANQASGVPFAFRVVAIQQVDHAERDTVADDLGWAQGSAVVGALRDNFAADLVVLLGAYANDMGICGQGYAGRNAAFGFSAINVSAPCPQIVLAHELGHNFGLHHDEAHDTLGTPDPAYARGFVHPQGGFATIMAGGDANCANGGACNRLVHWSDPDATQHTDTGDFPTGIRDQADNGRALRDVWTTIETYRIPPSIPLGSFDPAEQSNPSGTLHVTGWARDGDTPAPIDVHIYDNGVGRAFSANKARSDVGAHGFEEFLPVTTEGSHTICVYAIDDKGYGPNPSLGCRSINVSIHPVGVLEAVGRSPAGVELVGWAIDPQAGTAPINVRIDVDGVTVMTDNANRDRGDVAAQYPQYGSLHGFHPVLSPSAGTHRFCVTALNVGQGEDKLLGCVDHTVSVDPYGTFGLVGQGPGGVMVAGWVIDPDTANPIPVAFTVDGAPAGGELANRYRGDLTNPDYGPNHGYQYVVPMVSGMSHTVCAVAANHYPGTAHTTLGCRQYEPSPSPWGNYEAAWRTSDVIATIAGWAIEPDLPGPAVLRITIDGTETFTGTAEQNRPDVGNAHPGFGPNHGFRVDVPVLPGPHQVCVVIPNAGPGADTNLGCRGV